MATDDTGKTENTGTDDSKAKETIKSLVKEALGEWAEEQQKTRTETTKPKSLLEGLLNF